MALLCAICFKPAGKGNICAKCERRLPSVKELAVKPAVVGRAK